MPDFKLEKWIIDRRVALLEAEGVELRYGVDVGSDVGDGRARWPSTTRSCWRSARASHRDLDVPGRELEGVAVRDALPVRAQPLGRCAAASIRRATVDPLSAEGKHVVVIGGGDTAMDCVANAHRERAMSVTMLDTYPRRRARTRATRVPWPEAPRRLVTTYALDEGGERRWTQTASRLEGRDGHVTAVHGNRVGPRPAYEPIPGSEFELPADLVLIAIGFSHPEHEGADHRAGPRPRPPRQRQGADVRDLAHGVFAAGDARIGQSLIVNAIAEGRRCARVVDRWLEERPV